jgi:hypothetical protein
MPRPGPARKRLAIPLPPLPTHITVHQHRHGDQPRAGARQWGIPMTTKLSVQVDAFKPLKSNTLHGFCDITVPEMHLKIRDLAVHEKNNSRWVGLPAKPLITRDGQIKRDERNKIIYSAILEFTDRETRDAFSDRVIAALLIRFPDAFSGEAAA